MKKILVSFSIFILYTTVFSLSLNSILLYSGVTEYNYHETAPSNESGILPNIGFVYTHNFSNKLQLNTAFDYQENTLSYTGKTWSGTPISSSANHIFYDGNITLGYNISSLVHINSPIYLYSGYGQYLWVRDSLADSTPSKGDYTEHYQWEYIPLGVSSTTFENSRFSLGWNLEYDFLLNPQVFAYLSQTGNGWGDVSLALGNSYSLLLGLTASYNLTPNWYLYIKPTYQYIRLQKSNSSYIPNTSFKVYEPSSITNVWSCLMGIGYNF